MRDLLENLDRIAEGLTDFSDLEHKFNVKITVKNNYKVFIDGTKDMQLSDFHTLKTELDSRMKGESGMKIMPTKNGEVIKLDYNKPGMLKFSNN